MLLNGFGLQSLLRKLGLNTRNLVRETILKRLRCFDLIHSRTQLPNPKLFVVILEMYLPLFL